MGSETCCRDLCGTDRCTSMDRVVSDNSCSLAKFLSEHSTIWFEGFVVRCLVSSLRILYGDELALLRFVSHERSRLRQKNETFVTGGTKLVYVTPQYISTCSHPRLTDSTRFRIPNDDDEDDHQKCRGIIVTCSSEPS